MDLKQIKELMVAMGRTGIKKLLIKKEDFELQLEREAASPEIDESAMELPDFTQRRANQVVDHSNTAISKPIPHEIPTALHPPVDQPVIPVKAKEEGTYIHSPMVGTFYASSGPDEPSFVKPGDKVDKDTVVCIIEAMKVMNEVKAGVSGTIAEVLIENGHPVEFKSKLFKII